jgi:hypothetical protein
MDYGITMKLQSNTVTCMCDYRRDLGWWMDILTTYKNDLELQVIAAPLLISTIHHSTR